MSVLKYSFVVYYFLKRRQLKNKEISNARVNFQLFQCANRDYKANLYQQQILVFNVAKVFNRPTIAVFNVFSFMEVTGLSINEDHKHNRERTNLTPYNPMTKMSETVAKLFLRNVNFPFFISTPLILASTINSIQIPFGFFFNFPAVSVFRV